MMDYLNTLYVRIIKVTDKLKTGRAYSMTEEELETFKNTVTYNMVIRFWILRDSVKVLKDVTLMMMCYVNDEEFVGNTSFVKCVEDMKNIKKFLKMSYNIDFLNNDFFE